MILLRKAAESDIAVIQHLAKNTWPQAYGDIISAEQIRYMLDKMYSKDELLQQIREGHTFLIASEHSADLGFAGFSLTEPLKQVYKLHKLYVLPKAHGLGTGKLLINEVLSQLKQLGAKSLQLNVNRKNRAVDFYKNAGFVIIETVDLDIGNGFYMNDYLMEKPIG